MLSIDPNNSTDKENHKLLIGSIIPRPIAFVTSTTEDGTVNGAPFSYFNVVSSTPPMISLSIQRKNESPKDTARNIIDNKEFVVHIVDEHNVDKINETAASLPPDESEIEKADLTLVESDTVSVPGIKEAKVRLECTLERSIELGENNVTDLIIGNVVRYHIDEEIYDTGRINPTSLGAVSRLAGSNYSKLGDIFSIERPK